MPRRLTDDEIEWFVRTRHTVTRDDIEPVWREIEADRRFRAHALRLLYVVALLCVVGVVFAALAYDEAQDVGNRMDERELLKERPPR